MKLQNSTVAVTGGAGFIGSHLVDRLVEKGNCVLVVDDLSSGHRRNLARHKNNPAVKVFELDICDEKALAVVLEGVRCVFHLACRNVRLSLRQPTIVHDVNATGTLNTLKASAAAGVERYLYCSSSEVNGTADVVPMPEDYTFRPETIYGASKLTGEYYTQVFQRAGWLQTVIARPHNNYGPREHYAGISGEVIPRFILMALAGKPLTVYGDGAQTRDFTYVAETADFLLRLLECDEAVGGTYNVCRGKEESILHIASLILELTGSMAPLEHLPARPSDVLRLYGDNTRLRELLGEAPSTTIEQGLAQTVAWFRKNIEITQDVLDAMQQSNWQDYPPEPWLQKAGHVS